MCNEKNCNHEKLMEMTYNQLLRQTKTGETVRNSPRESNSNKVQIQEVVLNASLGDKTLTAKGRTRTTNKNYETIIVFSGVTFFNEGGHGRQEIQVSDGSSYFIDPIRPYKSNVKVRCTCLDFYFRWSVWDQRDELFERNNMILNSKTLFHEMKNYVRKDSSYAGTIGVNDDCVSAVLIVIRILEEMATYDDQAYVRMYNVEAQIQMEGKWDYTADDITRLRAPDYEEYDENETPMPFII